MLRHFDILCRNDSGLLILENFSLRENFAFDSDYFDFLNISLYHCNIMPVKSSMRMGTTSHSPSKIRWERRIGHSINVIRLIPNAKKKEGLSGSVSTIKGSKYKIHCGLHPTDQIKKSAQVIPIMEIKVCEFPLFVFRSNHNPKLPKSNKVTQVGTIAEFPRGKVAASGQILSSIGTKAPVVLFPSINAQIVCQEDLLGWD